MLTKRDKQLGLTQPISSLDCDIDECQACGRIINLTQLLQTPLGYYLCANRQGCSDYCVSSEGVYVL